MKKTLSIALLAGVLFASSCNSNKAAEEAAAKATADSLAQVAAAQATADSLAKIAAMAADTTKVDTTTQAK